MKFGSASGSAGREHGMARPRLGSLWHTRGPMAWVGPRLAEFYSKSTRGGAPAAGTKSGAEGVARGSSEHGPSGFEFRHGFRGSGCGSGHEAGVGNTWPKPELETHGAVQIRAWNVDLRAKVCACWPAKGGSPRWTPHSGHFDLLAPDSGDGPVAHEGAGGQPVGTRGGPRRGGGRRQHSADRLRQGGRALAPA